MKKRMRTFEEIAIDKLKELGSATRKEWARSLGYKTPNAFYYTLKKLIENRQVIENRHHRPFTYTVNKQNDGGKK